MREAALGGSEKELSAELASREVIAKLPYGGKATPRRSQRTLLLPFTVTFTVTSVIAIRLDVKTPFTTSGKEQKSKTVLPKAGLEPATFSLLG